MVSHGRGFAGRIESEPQLDSALAVSSGARF
jgi:hypothetical protein